MWWGIFSLRDMTVPKFTARFFKRDTYGSVLPDLHKELSGTDWEVFMGDENVALLLADEKTAAQHLTDGKL